MVFIRCLLIVLLMLSATFSVAMDAGHVAMSDTDHPVVETMADEMPACCDDGSERGQVCHGLAAMLPSADGHNHAPAMDKDVFAPTRLLLSGIEPSGPLDPPRVM